MSEQSTISPMRRGHALMSELKELWQWWRHELRELAVVVLERVFPSRAWRVTLSLRDADAKVQVAHGKNLRDDIVVPTVLNALPEASVSFWPSHYPARVRATALLPASKVLFRSLVLPLVSDRDLGQIVSLRLERELPLAQSGVYVDWCVNERSVAENRMVVGLAIAKRSDVDALRSSLERWGWKVLGVGVAEGGEFSGPGQFNFSKMRAASSSPGADRLERRLQWSAVGLLCIVAAITLGRWAYEYQSVRDTVLSAERELREFDSNRARLSTLSEPIRAISNRMQQSSSIDILAKLTELMPSDSWVYQLEVNTAEKGTGVIKLSGMTAAPAALVDVLEQSNEFASVELRSSNSAGLGSDRQRVEIAAQWIPVHIASSSPQ